MVGIKSSIFHFMEDNAYPIQIKILSKNAIDTREFLTIFLNL